MFLLTYTLEIVPCAVGRLWVCVYIYITLLLQYAVVAAPNTFNLDIALMKLATPVKLNDAVNLICLPDTDDKFPPGTECLTAGWGHTKECTYVTH